MSSSQAFADRVQSLPCPSCLAAVDVAHVEPLSTIACPSCGKEITVPGVVGSLILKKLIGRGSAGIVYQAFDKKLNKDVAVKVFLRQPGPSSGGGAAGNVDIVEKCLAEARAMTALSHPNIVEIYDVAQKGERPFIVMELLTGDRLDTVINNHLLVEEHRALRMAIDVASGLKAVHDAGFAHLDVKPANIQMTGEGICKLLDYDTARAHGDIAASGAGLVGTPYYVAPEIIRRGVVDFRADMYSLGATLFHLIAQRPPFQGQTPREVVQERLKRKAVNLREIRSDVSEATAVVINKMLEAEPADRYADYDHLLADLRKAQADAVERAMKSGASAPRAIAGSPVSASRTPYIYAAIAALVAVIIGIIWFTTKPGDTTPPVKDSRLASSRDSSAANKDSFASPPLPGKNITGKDAGAATKVEPRSNDPFSKDKNATDKDAKSKDDLPPVTIRPIDDIKPLMPVVPPPDPDTSKDKTSSDPVKVDPVKPAPTLVRSEKEVDGWRAGSEVTLKHKPGVLEVWSVGDEPSINIAGIKGPGQESAGAVLELRLKASGQGNGKVFWSSEVAPEFDGSRAQPIAIKHDSQWHDYLIPIPAKGNTLELRISFGSAPGIFEIQSISYFADAKALRPTKQWKFE